ncbi:hypothetical protein SAMN02910297_00639 [Methanobrevibacter olleyae]|uniref:Uncharacterized protein n=1 Tax=Methanobrevibacter olleyae TaxID=294671 RepID=A0A1I4GXX9_METOL|nr:hypothetical protein [Methanobrevibacter olleyae]SFL34809.1 hypothetical protein SAMN02910297_00639 [Methanobrevibacter olleyae]
MVKKEACSGSKLLIKKFSREEDLRGYNICADKLKVSKKVRAFDLEDLAGDKKLRCFLLIETIS